MELIKIRKELNPIKVIQVKVVLTEMINGFPLNKVEEDNDAITVIIKAISISIRKYSVHSYVSVLQAEFNLIEILKRMNSILLIVML